MIWKITTFGGLKLSFNEHPHGRRLSRHSKALIAFLALHPGKNVRREELSDVLWSANYDNKHQRRLSTILWRLNHTRDAAGNRIKYSMLHIDPNGDVRIEPDNCTWIDLAEFQRVFKGIPANPAHISNYDIALIERAVDLYRGDLLPEFDVEWAQKVRDHARQCYLEMLQILIDRFTSENVLDKLATYADRYLRVDPYVEHVHVALISAYLASGRRSLAAASAEACQRIFVDDLGVAPSPEAECVLKPLLPPRRAGARRMRFTSQERTRIDRVDELRDTLSQLLVTCAALLDELQTPGARSK